MPFLELVDEIVSFTNESRETVCERLWSESVSSGVNVTEDAKRFGVTPHVFNDAMIDLYQHSDSFIYETLAYWQLAGRRQWIERAVARLRGAGLAESRILMFGDGAGSDSIYLWNNGIKVDYFDYPGSRTYDFAMHRFDRQELPIPCISPEQLGKGDYDAVICFEVLEHMPNPREGIRTIRDSLRDGGIALITEAFGAVSPNRPTHLASNRYYAYVTPFLFLAEGLTPSWVQRPWKPMEFTKRRGLPPLAAFIFSGARILQRLSYWW